MPDRRDEILAAATRLFAENGYGGVGMRAIAEAVGIRPSSLYHHFPAKIDLLYAISLVASDAFTTAQLPRLEGDEPPLQRLERVLRAHMRYFHDHRLEESVSRRELGVLAAQAPARHAEVQASRRAYQDAIERLLAEFDVDDPRLTALAILDLINGMQAWFRDDGRASLEAVTDAYLAMVRRLLAVHA